jgi:hypothetical protein
VIQEQQRRQAIRRLREEKQQMDEMMAGVQSLEVAPS